MILRAVDVAIASAGYERLSTACELGPLWLFPLLSFWLLKPAKSLGWCTQTSSVISTAISTAELRWMCGCHQKGKDSYTRLKITQRDVTMLPPQKKKKTFSKQDIMVYRTWTEYNESGIGRISEWLSRHWEKINVTDSRPWLEISITGRHRPAIAEVPWATERINWLRFRFYRLKLQYHSAHFRSLGIRAVAVICATRRPQSPWDPTSL